MAILVNPTGPGQKISGMSDMGLPRTFFTSFPNLENGPYVITALLMGVDYLIMKDADDKKAAEIMFRSIEKYTIAIRKETPGTGKNVGMEKRK